MGRGRKPKDPALAARDQYWARKLQERQGESLGRLERGLFPDLKRPARADKAGYSQPNAMAKYAAGTRGVSPYWGPIPAVVRRAEAYCAGSSQPFLSILWPVLSQHYFEQDSGIAATQVSTEVRQRLRPEHTTSIDSLGRWRLTKPGIHLVGQMTHIDALGLLLFHSPRHAGVNASSLIAEQYVKAGLARLCRADLTFQSMGDSMIALIRTRFPLAVNGFDRESTDTPRPRMVSDFVVGLERMLRGGR